MRNKFLGTGEPGYPPIRKVLVILNGLKFSVLHDFRRVSLFRFGYLHRMG
jgi:hypothetical protein